MPAIFIFLTGTFFHSVLWRQRSHKTTVISDTFQCSVNSSKACQLELYISNRGYPGHSAGHWVSLNCQQSSSYTSENKKASQVCAHKDPYLPALLSSTTSLLFPLILAFWRELCSQQMFSDKKNVTITVPQQECRVPSASEVLNCQAERGYNPALLSQRFTHMLKTP